MLPKKAYKLVLASVEHYRKQDEMDRKESPGRMPAGWGIPLRMSFEKIVRETHKYHGRESVKTAVEETLRYLVEKGILIDYHGDFTFPSRAEELPTKAQIEEHALSIFNKIK